jgi:hypothetical protein
MLHYLFSVIDVSAYGSHVYPEQGEVTPSQISHGVSHDAGNHLPLWSASGIAFRRSVLSAAAYCL